MIYRGGNPYLKAPIASSGLGNTWTRRFWEMEPEEGGVSCGGKEGLQWGTVPQSWPSRVAICEVVCHLETSYNSRSHQEVGNSKGFGLIQSPLNGISWLQISLRESIGFHLLKPFWNTPAGSQSSLWFLGQKAEASLFGKVQQGCFLLCYQPKLTTGDVPPPTAGLRPLIW